ncbi:glycosyl transferase family 2 [Candidatus Magnetomorum sp. HK-1]|nr:glycosyl transferase family 2 [Candidatus Magnetomorum sp. HK-1]
MSFSVLIPAYNEEDSIRSVLIEMNEVLSNSDQEFEIIVINDCSTDETKREVIESGIQVRLIDHKINKGYGAALKTGIRQSAHDWIVITDADGTYPNEMILKIVNTAIENDYDMVVGSRTGPNVNIPLIRKPAKWAINYLANYLTRTKIPDLNSGLRAMKKSLLLKHMNILPDGFSLTSTITMAALTNENTVKYIPIDYYHRKGTSKIRPIHDTLNFIQLIIRTAIYFDPLRVFIPFSLLLIITAFIVLIVSLVFFEHVMDVTFGVILMTSIIVLSIGILADFIDKRIN